MEGAREELREFFYEETDCDDPENGELLRMNLVHYQVGSPWLD